MKTEKCRILINSSKTLVKNFKNRTVLEEFNNSESEEGLEKEYYNYVSKVQKYIGNIEKNCRIGFFSQSAQNTDMYSYVYYIMTAGLIGYDISSNVGEMRDLLADYQREDGLCYDDHLLSYRFINGDGWGARHFMLHYFIALERLKMPLKHRLRYLDVYKEMDIEKLLDTLDWHDPWKSSNFVMNISIALMYERMCTGDEKTKVAIRKIQKWLIDNIREDSGMWGCGDINIREVRYLMIRGAYHLLPILMYDNIDIPYRKKAIDIILNAQNKAGGFDSLINSSACDDIDAIEPLIRLSLMERGYRENDIRRCLCKAIRWVMRNQLSDGGSVFCLESPFCYGDSCMKSGKNESNWFGTWFRLLSVCYMYDYLFSNNRDYVDIPGMEYPLFR